MVNKKPKYRIKAQLNENFEYQYEPQVYQGWFTGWANIIATVKNRKNNDEIIDVDDVKSFYISRSAYITQRCKLESTAKTIIKAVDIETKRLEKLRIESKNKKKVYYIIVDPDEE